jgi:hypothetical protein
MSLDTYDSLESSDDVPPLLVDDSSPPWWRRPEPIVALAVFLAFRVQVLLRHEVSDTRLRRRRTVMRRPTGTRSDALMESVPHL